VDEAFSGKVEHCPAGSLCLWIVVKRFEIT
jgi:hypothetical protein